MERPLCTNAAKNAVGPSTVCYRRVEGHVSCTDVLCRALLAHECRLQSQGEAARRAAQVRVRRTATSRLMHSHRSDCVKRFTANEINSDEAWRVLQGLTQKLQEVGGGGAQLATVVVRAALTPSRISAAGHRGSQSRR